MAKGKDMNEIKEQFNYVKENSSIADYAERHLQKAKGKREKSNHGKYVCPYCNSGANHNSGFSIYTDTNSFYCHACDVGGDIFKLASKCENIREDETIEQLKAVASFSSIRLDLDEQNYYKTKNTPQNANGGVTDPKETSTTNETNDTADKKDYSTGRKKHAEYIARCQQTLKDESKNREAVAYLASRGIRYETAVNLGVGYDERTKRIIIPCKGSNFYHFDRSITDNAQIKHCKPKSDEVGKQPIYNPNALNEKTVFLVEGEFDALTLHALGFDNVIMTGGGVSCVREIINLVKQQSKSPTFLLMFDNDDKGREFTEQVKLELQNEFTKDKFDYREIDTTSLTGKDANEILKNDADGLKSILTAQNLQALEEREKGINKAYSDTLARYNIQPITNINSQIYNAQCSKKVYSTGFNSIDESLNGGFHATNLIILGACSSVGKTSLLLQIAANVAKNNPVLFVSIEQNAQELQAKLISCYSRKLQHNKQYALPYFKLLDLKKWTGNDIEKMRHLEQAIQNFENDVKNNLHLMQCNERPKVEEIEQIASTITKYEGEPPVIFIDYLQLLQAQDKRDQERQITDKNLTALKQMANRLITPVVLISSFNRQAYDDEITFSSFKESGCIEYSADVLLGLQPSELAEKLLTDKGAQKTGEYRKIAARACYQRYKDKGGNLVLRILKHRNGKTDNAGVVLSFDKEYNYFEDVQQTLKTGKMFKDKQDEEEYRNLIYNMQ